MMRRISLLTLDLFRLWQVERLDLAGLGLGAGDLRLLADALGAMGRLRELVLYDNRLEAGRLEALAAALPGMTALADLRVLRRSFA